MKDRFDLESEIMMTYNFAQQLRSISNAVVEKELDQDKIANVLEGIAILIELHTDEMFDTFTECFRLDQHNDKTDLFYKRNHVI